MITLERFEETLNILEKTNLNWTVKKEALLRPNLEPTNSYGLFHSKTDVQLGTVKEGYQVYQNYEMVQDITSLQSVDLENVKGGQFKGGKQVFVSIPLEVSAIGRGDEIERYITFLNSHDGSSSICLGITNKVLSCSNMFYTVSKGLSKVRHNAKMKKNLNDLKLAIAETIEQEKTLIEAFNVLNKTEIQSNEVDEMINAMIPESNDEKEHVKKQRYQLEDCVYSEMQLKGNTKWGLFNGVTYYTNHIQSKHQVKNIMTGKGYRMNNEAIKKL